MGDLTLRIPKRIFVEDLVEDMTRETWAILLRAAPAEAAVLGSFVTIRTTLRHYLWSRIRSIGVGGKGARVFTVDIGHDEPETFGMEAAAAVAMAQEPLFEVLDSALRVARLIMRAVEDVLEPYRHHEPGPAVPRFLQRGGHSARRASIAREIQAELR
jgi:hypothetical protein